MRHAEPVPGDRMDETRGLTEKGKQQAADMGAWLAGHIGRVDIVIYSPFARCAETAAAMGKALGAHLADTRLLEPNGDPEEIWKEIERLAPQCKDVLVVGHHPSLNKLILWLMGGDGTQDDLKLEHAAIALVDTADDDTGTLCWLVTPEIVLANKDIVDAAESLTQSLSEAASGPQKRWIADDDACEVCQANADQGWIDADDTFDSGDDEPPAHPNCGCDLETNEGDESVDESLRESLIPDAANVEQTVKMRMVSELEDGGTLVQLEQP